jgi:excisionase family DNA binding protein
MMLPSGKTSHFARKDMGTSELSDRGAEWLCLREVTRYVNVSERTLRTWIHAPIDALPAVRVGGRILVRRSELDAWLTRRRIGTLDSVNIDAIVKDVLQGFGHGR